MKKGREKGEKEEKRKRMIKHRVNTFVKRKCPKKIHKTREEF